MADQVKVPRSISKEQFLDQIRAGVFDAMHELLMSGGSGSPGDNFFSAVRDGVREAVKAVARQHAMTERQEAQEQRSGSHDTSVEPPRGDPSSQS